MSPNRKAILLVTILVGLAIIGIAMKEYMPFQATVVSVYQCTSDADCTTISYNPKEAVPCCPSCGDYVVNKKVEQRIREFQDKECSRYGCPMAVCSRYTRLETRCKNGFCIGGNERAEKGY